MKSQTFALVALASSAQLASATFGWLDATKFNCPANTDNKCVDPQKQGYNWAGSNLGNFAQYGGMDFSGWKMADSFDGNVKRDLITGRTFQNKCIKGRATPDYGSAPSFGCGSSNTIDKFSVKEYQVSVEFDCHLEFHYEMPDGSKCKQKEFCKKSGTTVKNTQCGGAKTVKIIYPPNYGGNKGNGCNVGFHHIDFDCEKPQNPPRPPPNYNPSTSSTTTTTTTTTSSTSSQGIQTTTSEAGQSTTSTTGGVQTTTSSSSPTTTSAVSSLTTTSESRPTTTPSITTSKSPETTTSSKVYTPPFQLNTTSTTTTSSSAGNTKPSEPVYTTSVTTTLATTTSEGPKPTAPCPDVLPQCLNTWLFSSTCKSNTDVQCFCESTEYIDAVYKCLAAYGASDEIVDEAQKYLQGICASHIPNNPAIITATNTLTITASQAYSVPVTTISVTTTVVVPCSDTSVCGAPATSTISTALTVPQVVFQTITGTSTQAVSLVQGTAPAATGAILTPTGVPVPAPTTLASVVPTKGAAKTTGLQFTGAASKSGITLSSILAAGLLALLAM